MTETMNLRQRRELEGEWACAGIEPSLASLMDDSIFQLVRQCAGMTDNEFRRIVDEAVGLVRNRVRPGGVRKV